MARTDKRPNVLMLVADDQRHNTIGALNNPEVCTPTMNYLAEQGTAMTNMHLMGSMCDAVCMPSRVMLHSGRSLFHLEGNGEVIPPDHLLLGEHLQKHGYTTYGSGKWHSDPDSFARAFADGGPVFLGGMDDHWNMPVCDYHRPGEYPNPVKHPWDPGYGSKIEIEKRFDYVATGTHATTLFADGAKRFLLERAKQEDKSQPFFCYCAFTAPHDPRTMPMRFRTMFPEGSVTLPPNTLPEHPFDNGALDIRDEYLAGMPRDRSEVEGHLRDYYAMLAHMDDEIGRIIDALEATGELENTIIVWTADHGLSVGQHGLMGKQNLYDHSCRIPFVITGPGVPRGTTRDQYAYLLDVVPTLCDLLDLPAPETVEGKSFISTLGDNEAHRSRLLLGYGEHQRALKTAGYKLIEYDVEGARHTQLFDLRQDPWETASLHEKPVHQERIRDMRKALSKESRTLDDTIPRFWEAEG